MNRTSINVLECGWKQLLRADGKHFIIFISCSLTFHRDGCRLFTDTKNVSLWSINKKICPCVALTKCHQHCRLWRYSSCFISGSLNRSFMCESESEAPKCLSSICIDFLPVLGLTVSPLDPWLVCSLWATAGISGEWFHFCNPAATNTGGTTGILCTQGAQSDLLHITYILVM